MAARALTVTLSDDLDSKHAVHFATISTIGPISFITLEIEPDTSR
jgi:hypothetical protein